MKPVIIAIGLACLSLNGCHHFSATDKAETLVDYTALERFAVDAVYDAHPTRALVDKIEALPNSDAGHTVVRVEMTGAPTVRKIYAVHVSELDGGGLQLERIEPLQ